MSLLELLNSDMKQALKDKDKTKLSVIRMVKSAIQNEQIKNGKELTDDQILTVLNRELKQRRDSLQEFKKAGREDLVSGIEAELKVLSAYMPEQLSETELREIIQQVIAELGASSKKEMGQVMGTVMPKVKGRADGTLVNKLVQEYLS